MRGPSRAGWALPAALLGAQAFAALGGALATLVLAGMMTPDAFGRGNALVGIAMLGSLALSGNLEAGAFRFLCTGTDADRARFLRASDLLILAGAILAIPLCLVIALPSGASMAEVALLLALFPALALFRARARQGAALGTPGRAALPRLVARPAAFLVLAAGVWITGAQPLAWALPTALLTATLAGLSIQHRLLRTRFHPLKRHGGKPGWNIDWLRTGIAFLPSLLLTEYHRALVLVVAGMTLSAAMLGHLALALSLAALPGLALIAMEMATTQRLTQAALSGDTARSAAILARIARARCLVLLAVLVPFVALLEPACARLFPGYPGLAATAWPLLAMPVGRALLGNPLHVLALKGENGAAFIVCGAGVGLTVPAILAGAMLAGAPGAALGAALAQTATGIALWALCRRRCGIDLSVLSLRRAESATLPVT
ncbi:hypothetical protein HMH01_01305 [Halovulum dunhuangense]|uniref:O-antigen/teichoic acid export membrane protein n=1 Tax=Halovulum dunhuangense TaxID=1505036 RepID=A0A849KYY4_9RHOB|nr:hypothetical protein [Halovulum dunhuangense]NNU79062.1 hypothetical protein [Halovulum dunhuangense]